MCHSERTAKGKTSHEVRYVIASRMAGAKSYGDALRNHWRIENCQHWQLDVSFGEDASRLQNRNTAENFAMLRRIALNLLKQPPVKAASSPNACEPHGTPTSWRKCSIFWGRFNA